MKGKRERKGENKKLNMKRFFKNKHGFLLFYKNLSLKMHNSHVIVIVTDI